MAKASVTSLRSAPNVRAERRSSPSRRQPKAVERFPDMETALEVLRPNQSVQCFHPTEIAKSAKAFLEGFRGDAFYAVKSNPDPYVLRHLYAAGIRCFDVASIGEVELVHRMFPDARLAFMHPVKSRDAIRRACVENGVRTFVLDSAGELDKIIEETRGVKDLTLVVRLERPKGSAACPLAGKFGATPQDTVELLKRAAKVAGKVGLSFHVGSQTLDPMSYVEAINIAKDVIRQSGVSLDVFDIGGGFPVPGMGMEVPSLQAFFEVINPEIAAMGLPAKCEIWCEPGRSLSGLSTTLLVKVELRKGDALYINDGSFGNMFEVCSMNWRNDSRRLRLNAGAAEEGRTPSPFRLFGPTCDSVDYMQGPFMLPDDIAEGDWIAMGSMGAYMAASQSRFNGFYSDLQVEISSGHPEDGKLVQLRPRNRRNGTRL